MIKPGVFVLFDDIDFSDDTSPAQAALRAN
jgi:hypothetical protein